MRLYYTVSSREDDVQAKSILSLGGFKSSTPVQNNVFNNLFSDLSLFSLEKASTEYVALMLVNERKVTTTNIKLWLENITDSYCKYRVSVVELSTVKVMERIPTINSMPFYAEFYEVGSVEEAISIPNMVVGSMFGIWIERSIDETSEVYIKRNDPSYLIANPTKYSKTFEDPKLKISFYE